ncbi:MAG: methionyl-tRNA synthetase/methionyl-tRNA synthetase subunit beta [Promethearchaeota archaeon CR_4]|nr:MAG: methionyl-tRNA synthetase/methionyl-tRNA synthetase subunit beta [Candidatus Lokiarchaeota archaeon CR_4]
MSVSYDEFSKLDIRVGIIKSAEIIPKSRNLMKLQVDVGETAPRQIVAGLQGHYAPETLVGKKIVVLVNLAPRKLMGIESQGMLIAADVNNTPFLLEVDETKVQDVPAGARIH